MNYQEKSKEEIIWELQRLKQEYAILKTSLKNNNDEHDLAVNKFQMLFEQSGIGMALVNHETGHFLAVNNSVLEATGYSEEEFLNLSYWDITPRQYEAQEKKQLQELNETGRFGPYFKEYIRKDGTRYPISISGALFKNDNGDDVVWGVIEDITKRKQEEVTITKHNAELKKLNEDKDRFITIIAHDLKSPFSNVLGLLNLLTENIHSYPIDEIEELLNLTKDSAQNTFTLLDDILTWVRANSNHIKYKPEKLNFTKLLNKSIESLELTVKAKNVTIINLSDTDITVFADKNMLKTVLRNIISNAVKFSNHQGIITISVEENANEKVVTISDNGVGMKPKILNALFDISNIKSALGTANEKGTGLGLIICKEFIEKQGGAIWAESELGKGSEIRFTLPLHEIKPILTYPQL